MRISQKQLFCQGCALDAGHYGMPSQRKRGPDRPKGGPACLITKSCIPNPAVIQYIQLITLLHHFSQQSWSVVWIIGQVLSRNARYITPTNFGKCSQVSITTQQSAMLLLLAATLQSHAVPEACHEAHVAHLVDDGRRGGAMPPLPLPAQALFAVHHAAAHQVHHM